MNTESLEISVWGDRSIREFWDSLKGQASRSRDVPPSQHVDVFHQSEKLLELW